MRWIRDNDFEPRYPFWTRANVSEVLPEPPTPLGWDLPFEGATVAGWRDLMVQRMGMEDHEVNRDRVEALGIFGGYAYLGAALFRIWAGRTPGMTPATIDEFYFGDHPDVPPYVAEDWHTNPHTTDVMTRWLQWATVELNQDELEADRLESLEVRANRPNLSHRSNEALLGYMISMRPLLRRMFHQHINQSAAAAVGPGILAQVCTAIGQPQWAMRLMAGLGGVDSAAPSYVMWELSRQARDSASVASLFEAGVDGLYERLDRSSAPDVTAFRDAFDKFLAEFGSRGTNEWELASRVWELEPASALAAIERMRLTPDERSPLAENAAREAERLELEANVREMLAGNDEALGAFEAGLRSAATFIPGRERSKTSIIRVLHEVRMVTDELGRRLADVGRLPRGDDIYLLFVDELNELVAGNLDAVAELVGPRRDHREWLASLEPPFIIAGEPKHNTSWPRRGERAVAGVSVGDEIVGVPGCPGLARGRARVLLDPCDPTALEPGDILVAPATDPSWTPLFVPAAGVVVDVGAALSHAVIVSRELGIPCVAAAVDATRRIPDGSLIAVDGDRGVVTLLELPA